MNPEIIIPVVVLTVAYIVLNLYVTRKINRADYFIEERKSLHKKFIWILPFLGPLSIRSFWKTKKDEGLDVMTKDKRGKGKWNMNDNWQNTTGFGGGMH